MHCAGGSGYEAFFGGGTKLTVLENDHAITPPTVKIFAPSKNERPRRKGETKAKTLVCVASDFYPDHVTVSWQIDGENTKAGVATDSIPQRTDRFYTISSRLRVPVDKWKSQFTCTVHFCNGTDSANKPTYNNYTASFEGIEGNIHDDEDGITREQYLRITQSAKLSYAVFIVKSVVYGLFVTFLVWRIQRSNLKHT